MNRTARAALTVPIAALAMSGVVVAACRGGGTGEGLDGGWGDGDAIHQSSQSQACEKSIIAIDDTAAASDGSSPGCANDNDCTVRLAGDYCACPSTLRPMLVSRAAAFDQSLDGVTKKCTCEMLPCVPITPGKSVCRDGRCALADAVQ